MKPILKNSENIVYVDEATDRSSGSYPVVVKNIATGKEKNVKNVQILFKFGTWEDIDDKPNKAKFVLKGGPGSGFHDHAGRPGKVGGSSSSSTPTPVVQPVVRRPLDKRGGTAPSGNVELDRTSKDYILNGAKPFIMSVYDGEVPWGGYDAYEGSAICDEKIRQAAKKELCENISKATGVEYNTVVDVIHQWAETSNESYASLSLQEATSEELGVPLSEWQQKMLSDARASIDEWKQNVALIDEAFEWGYKYAQEHLPKGIADPKNEWFAARQAAWEELHPGTNFNKVLRTPKLLPPGAKALTTRENERAIIRAMYEATQESLKSIPGDDVLLYRGIHGKFIDTMTAGLIAGASVDYKGNTMESWASNEGTARDFTSWSESSAVLAMRVPKANVISTPFTGFGCLEEYEFVIMGSLDNQALLRYIRRQ